MGIKITYEETLSNYIIEAKLNGLSINIDDVQFNDFNNHIIQLDIFIKFEMKEYKEKNIKKYYFIFLHLYIFILIQ